MKFGSSSRLGVAILIAAAVVAGCAAGAPGPASSGSAAAAAPATQPADGAGLALPPGIPPGLVTPRRDQALVQARLALPQVLATVVRPAYLPAAGKPAPTTAPAAAATTQAHQMEPPLLAQQKYVEALGAWVEDRNQGFQAIARLQEALAIAPDQSAVLRLLGLIYTAQGNKARGAFYLQKAVTQDASDLESIFLLGRFALEAGDWHAAIADLAYVLEQAGRDHDPGIIVLAHFHLGTALVQAGYDAAAIEQFRQYLEMPARPSGSTRYLRDLVVLSRQHGVSYLEIGDACNRLDQPQAALKAYQQVREAGGVPLLEGALAARLVYTQLRLGLSEEAQNTVIENLRQQAANPESLALVDYLARAGLRPRKLAQQMQTIYEQGERPTALAVAIANLLDEPAASTFLRAHLQAKPADQQVFAQLLKRQLKSGPQGKQNNLAAAVLVTAQAAEKAPENAQQYVESLLAVSDLKQLLQTCQSLQPAGGKVSPGLLMIQGITLVRLGQIDQAIGDLEKALASDANLDGARLALAGQLAKQRKLERAQELLKPLVDKGNSDAVDLSVQILAQTNHADQALALLDQMIAKKPMDVDLVISKARLQWERLNDPLAAERTLLDALNRRPDAEKIYEVLLRLYDTAEVGDSVRQYERLMRRLFQTLPQSRIARLERVKFLVNQGDTAQAEQILRALVLENPRDYTALVNLLELLAMTNRREQAEGVLKEHLEKFADDPQLLRVAAGYYQGKDEAKAFEYQEKFVLLHPEGPERTRSLAVLYIRNDRADQAAALLSKALAGDTEEPQVLLGLLGRALAATGKPELMDAEARKALQRFPKHEADLLFEWASFRDQQGQRKQAEQMLLDLLKKHPGHAGAGNNLAYYWATQGERLQEALQLGQQAVQAEPDNTSYLDTVGWVHYKLGDFPEAVRWLRRARDAENGQYPVILDHLGDALYRLQRNDEALQAWIMAQQRLARLAEEGLDLNSDNELKTLGRNLQSKIDAITGKRQVPVADLPKPAAVGQAPAPPATQPLKPAALP